MKNYTLAISIALLASGAGLALADSLEDAHAQFREGVTYFAQGDWASARAAFEQAHRLHPDARILANVADCLAREGRMADAAETYRRALRELGAELDEATRLAIEEKLTALQADVCDVRVTGDPPGGEVIVDGEVIGTVPMQDSVAVMPGRRTVEVRLEGYAPFRRSLDARGGQRVQLSIGLALTAALTPTSEPDVPAPPPAPVLARATRVRAPGPPSERRIGRGPLFWTGLAITGALALGATVTGVLSLEREREYRDPSTTVERRHELWGSREALPLMTDVLIDAAVVVGAATVALFVLGGPGEEEYTSRSASVSRLFSKGAAACDLGWSF